MPSRKRAGHSGGHVDLTSNIPVQNQEDHPSHFTETESDVENAALHSDHHEFHSGSLSGEWGNIYILTFLYILQGIPLGLASSIPMILQNRKVTYAQQAIFSFVHWPFSIKLLWAPLVDSWYSASLGRRKTWLIPTQYLIGISMLTLSKYSDDLFGSEDDSPNVPLITAVFFVLCFLAATQDIAVDGWALNMLSRQNVGYASTCNCVGQTAGYFIGYVVFLAFESASFCNRYLRTVPQDKGIIILEDFLFYWGIIFIISTTLVGLLKKEKRSFSKDEVDFGIVGTYKVLWKIIQLPNIRVLVFFLLTAKIAVAASEAISGLKLTEHGVPKEQLAMLAVPLVPLQILLPLLISRRTAGSSPLNVYANAYPYRLAFGLILPLVVYIAPYMKSESGDFSGYYYLLLLVIYAFHQVFANAMFVAVVAFFAKISDPSVGGTYMTLLNTLANLGGNWPITLALYLVDPLTSKRCEGVHGDKTCNTVDESHHCQEEGGTCVTVIDGYYVECIACFICGLLWLKWAKPVVEKLKRSDKKSWSCYEYKQYHLYNKTHR